MKKRPEEVKGIKQNLKLAVQFLDGTNRTVDYTDRNTAQIDIDSKYVFKMISKEEWGRLTDLLSSTGVLLATQQLTDSK